jgi:hypothetical protein
MKMDKLTSEKITRRQVVGTAALPVNGGAAP